VVQRLLDPRDKGRTRWSTNVERLRVTVAALPSAPLSEVLGPTPSEQDRRKQDPAREALQTLTAALGQLANELPEPRPHRLRGIAAQLRRCNRELERAQFAGSPTLADVGNPLPRSAAELVATVADLLIVLAEHPELLRRGKRVAGQSWTDAGRVSLSEHRDLVLQSERQIIQEEMTGRSIRGDLRFIPASPQQLPSTDLVDGRWVIIVDLSQWDSGSFLEDITPDHAQALAHRVIAVPTRRGRAIPAGAVAITPSGVEGISSTQIREIADLVELPVHEPQTYRVVHNAVPTLLRASGLMATTAIGKASSADEGVPHRARELLEIARKATQRITDAEVAEPWARLCDAVELEIRGKRRDGLAAQTARAVKDEPRGELLALLQQVLGRAAFGN
jgi:hypothetical protein